MSHTLFMFSYNNPLDNVPLHHIKQVIKTEQQYTFHLVDDEGKKTIKTKPVTNFITQQLTGYQIEVTG